MQRVLKKHLTPLSKKGQIVNHKGKGASDRPLVSGQAGLNDYTKATPMAQPQGPSDYDADDPMGM